MGDCNLVCTSDGFRLTEQLAKTLGNIHEFVGPAKVVLVDPDPLLYWKKTWAAAFIAMAYCAIGAAIFPVIFFTLDFKLKLHNNLHIYLCTIGFQLFVPCAYLALNHYNSTSNLMNDKQKRFEAILLKLCGFGCAGVGTILVIMYHEMSFASLHAIFGAVAAGFGIIDVVHLLCICCLHTNHLTSRIVLMLALPSLIASSICFCLGVFHPTFLKWSPSPYLSGFIAVYCCFYTLIIIVDPIRSVFWKDIQ